ncbi:fasciclin domain-containing protein [Psychroserpens sp. XS_ASV72]|uniref:fasciclin domain-containing protein n=1 Tax=Psychroserpens sp. XS_ASV72 TaxID=3241293 RepID=UPI0035187294
MKTLIKLSIFLILLGCFLACNNSKESSKNITNQTESNEISNEKTGQAFIKDEGSTPNALQLAMQSQDHTTLVAAVEAAGVENALVNVGPLTVFAPNNAAFAKIDEVTLNNLLKPENKGQLALILTNHVAPSNYPIDMLKKNADKNRKLYMASGEYIEVTQQNGDLYVGGTKIIATVNVSNGWVHVVEDVILPKN